MHIFSKCVRFMGESAGYWPEMAHSKAFLLALSCTRAYGMHAIRTSFFPLISLKLATVRNLLAHI